MTLGPRDTYYIYIVCRTRNTLSNTACTGNKRTVEYIFMLYMTYGYVYICYETMHQIVYNIKSIVECDVLKRLYNMYI